MFIVYQSVVRTLRKYLGSGGLKLIEVLFVCMCGVGWPIAGLYDSGFGTAQEGRHYCWLKAKRRPYGSGAQWCAFHVRAPPLLAPISHLGRQDYISCRPFSPHIDSLKPIGSKTSVGSPFPCLSKTRVLDLWTLPSPVRFGWHTQSLFSIVTIWVVGCALSWLDKQWQLPMLTVFGLIGCFRRYMFTHAPAIDFCSRCL